MVGLAWLSVVGEKASLTDKKACLAFPYLHSRRASVTPSKHRCSGFANMPNLVILRQNCSDDSTEVTEGSLRLRTFSITNRESLRLQKFSVTNTIYFNCKRC